MRVSVYKRESEREIERGRERAPRFRAGVEANRMNEDEGIRMKQVQI